MSSSLSPAVTEGYRKELRQTLVPGLNKVVEKLCKDLNDLVQGALNQRKLLLFAHLPICLSSCVKGDFTFLGHKHVRSCA